jgi:hypothetical protein
MSWEGGIGILEMDERVMWVVFGGKGVRVVFGLIPILAMGGGSSLDWAGLKSDEICSWITDLNLIWVGGWFPL